MDNIIELKIKGMTCDGCASHVSKALESVDGVKDVKGTSKNLREI